MNIPKSLKNGPGHSKLIPFKKTILEMKKKNESLNNIKLYLASKGINASANTINVFIKRRESKEFNEINQKYFTLYPIVKERKSPSKLNEHTLDILKNYYLEHKTLKEIQNFLREKNIQTSLSNIHFFLKKNKKRINFKKEIENNVQTEKCVITQNATVKSNEQENEKKYTGVKDDWREHVTPEEYSEIIFIAMYKVISGTEGNALRCHVTSPFCMNHKNPTDKNWDEGLQIIDDERLNKYGIESLWIKTMQLAGREDLLKK